MGGTFILDGKSIVKSGRGPPMTLGNAAVARVRLIVWCKECQHQVVGQFECNNVPGIS